MSDGTTRYYIEVEAQPLGGGMMLLKLPGWPTVAAIEVPVGDVIELTEERIIDEHDDLAIRLVSKSRPWEQSDG